MQHQWSLDFFQWSWIYMCTVLHNRSSCCFILFMCHDIKHSDSGAGNSTPWWRRNEVMNVTVIITNYLSSDWFMWHSWSWWRLVNSKWSTPKLVHSISTNRQNGTNSYTTGSGCFNLNMINVCSIPIKNPNTLGRNLWLFNLNHYCYYKQYSQTINYCMHQYFFW